MYILSHLTLKTCPVCGPYNIYRQKEVRLVAGILYIRVLELEQYRFVTREEQVEPLHSRVCNNCPSILQPRKNIVCSIFKIPNMYTTLSLLSFSIFLLLSSTLGDFRSRFCFSVFRFRFVKSFLALRGCRCAPL